MGRITVHIQSGLLRWLHLHNTAACCAVHSVNIPTSSFRNRGCSLAAALLWLHRFGGRVCSSCDCRYFQPLLLQVLAGGVWLTL
jgi:hypothetical protein